MDGKKTWCLIGVHAKSQYHLKPSLWMSFTLLVLTDVYVYISMHFYSHSHGSSFIWIEKKDFIEFESVPFINISSNWSSEKNWGMLPFWTMLKPANKLELLLIVFAISSETSANKQFLSTLIGEAKWWSNVPVSAGLLWENLRVHRSFLDSFLCCPGLKW